MLRIDIKDFAQTMAAVIAPDDGHAVALAVSGGPDSMALALCVQRWAASMGYKAPVAFIVDHRLRSESADEAALVQQRLAALGIKAEILVWQHSTITSRIHVLAREARYRLLTEACHRRDIKLLLTAHHGDDQAETIIMRLSRGSGVDGLGGMQHVTLTKDGLTLCRPFLAIPKARLVATCEAAGVAYVTDPSNASLKYGRGRLRQIMPLLAGEGLDLPRVLDLGERAGEARDALEHYTTLLLRQAATMDAAGVVRLEQALWQAAPKAVAMRALDACIRVVHPSDYPLERSTLLPLVTALSAPVMPPRTLHGCMISANAGTIMVQREPSAALLVPAVIVRLGQGGQAQKVRWDGRWTVTIPAAFFDNLPATAPITLRALGTCHRDVLRIVAPGLRKAISQGRIRATLPALWQGDVLLAVPTLTRLDGTAADILTARADARV